jgi:hypothetical protein
MWCCEAHVCADVSEESISSVIRLEKYQRNRKTILLTTKALTSLSIISSGITEKIGSSVTSLSTRATLRHIPEVGVLRSHLRGNLKPYLWYWWLHSKDNTYTFRGFSKGMKNVVFWDVTPCGSFRKQRFRGTYRLHRQGDRSRRDRTNAARKYFVAYFGF